MWHTCSCKCFCTWFAVYWFNTQMTTKSNGQQCELWTLHIFQFLSAILEYNVSDSLNSNMLGFYHNCLYHLECAIVGIDQLAYFRMYKFIYVCTWFNGSCFPPKFLNRMHSTSKWNTFTYFIGLEMILSYLHIHCKLIYKYQVISKWE